MRPGEDWLWCHTDQAVLDVPEAGTARQPSGVTWRSLMVKPMLVAVHGDREVLATLERDLHRRFGADYDVMTAAPGAVLADLERLREAGAQVALLLADQWLAGMTGVEFVCQAHQLQPVAKCMLFITYGDAAAGTAGLQAMALGQLDHYVNAPWGPPELHPYPEVGEALSQWARSTGRPGPPPELVRIVGPSWSPRSHELRDPMARNSISHGFHAADTADGKRLLARAGLEAGGPPVLLWFDGQVLVDPPNQRLARALGAVGASGSVSKNAPTVATPAMPSAMAWCILTNRPMRLSAGLGGTTSPAAAGTGPGGGGAVVRPRAAAEPRRRGPGAEQQARGR